MNYLAGGVNSPIPIPKYYPNNIVKGEGPYVIDSSGEKYVDMWMGYGALIFGHADKDFIKIAQNVLEKGWFYSYQTKIEKDYSALLHKYIPSAEVVRYATTGSDADAYAVRVARKHTGRKRILSIKGGYHGIHEGFITTEGMTIEVKPEYVKFNDVDSAYQLLKSKEFACMILEPVLANSGCTPPMNKYLQRLREICNKTGTILIFDEVVNGFRMSIGGSQKRFNVTPDISTFSKAIASGLPLSVVAGRKDLLENFIPTGKVFFAGTFNGHPLALAVAQEVFRKLKDGTVHLKLESLGNRFRAEIASYIEDLGANACIQGIGSMFTIAFGCKSFKQGIINEDFDADAYDEFINRMSRQKILFPPLPTETVFLSLVHKPITDMILLEIKKTLTSMRKDNII